MDTPVVCGGVRRAIAAAHHPAKRRVLGHQPRRFYATPTQDFQQDGISAASPIQFGSGQMGSAGQSAATNPPGLSLMQRLRVLPASPSYFTATPQFTDDLLYLSSLLRKHLLLPTIQSSQAPRVAWKSLEQYRTELAEPVRAKGHSQLVGILKRLNLIHPSLFPVEVEQAMQRYKRVVQPNLNQTRPLEMDGWGRIKAVGRRKSSSAAVWIVEGDGACLVNGKSLSEYFAKIHDRESAVWALKATQRLDKYNVFALVKGGGTTGQAEAITLGAAKALLAYEPDLKPALRRAGVVTRDPRRVERKKPGRVKARKMPTWVKR